MVVTEGLTAMLAPESAKGCQVNNVPGETALSVAGLPAQIEVGEATAAKAKGVTEMVVTAVVVPQPFCPLTVYVVVTPGKKETPLVTPLDQV